MFTAAEFRTRANQMVGVPYILGAEWQPSCVAPCIPKALDCSELVEGLFRENQTPIGDLAASQFDKTVAVAASQERVGDLVFLRNNVARWNGIGHVAVITAPLANGDWEIVESRGRTWGTVRTTLSYWRGRTGFTGVRRFPSFRLAQPPLGVVTPLPQPASRKRQPRPCAEMPLSLVQAMVGANPDGIDGPQTRARIARMRQRLGLRTSGRWGAAETEAWLLSQPTLREGSSGLAVKVVQWIVGASVDGQFGPRTGDAVAAAQSWCGISVDRIVGPQTKRAITI